MGVLIALQAIGACLGSATAAGAVCPNEASRTGPSADLPDCRAYELVTPPDTNGRLLESIVGLNFWDVFPSSLISPSGESFLYMTTNSPLDSPTDPTGTLDRYEARRAPSGWKTVRRLSPSGEQALIPYPGGTSVEHRYTFVHVSPFEGGASSGGTLAEALGGDYLGKPDGSFELVGVGDLGSEPLAQGRFIGSDGAHVIFNTGGDWCQAETANCVIRQLEDNAPPTGTPAIYDRSADGDTRVISLLPGNAPPGPGQGATYQGSSADGSAVAFKIAGTLYVRLDNAETKEVTAASATYAGLSEDGDELFYVSGGNIFRFEALSGETKQVNASGDAEVTNISADGSHVYFISPSQLDGVKGTAGKPNLYVWSGGTAEYIATVAPGDLERTSGNLTGFPALGNWTDWAVTPAMAGSELGRGPGAEASRSTPDGSHLVFESRARLSAYDNDGHTEIYRYDDGDKSLVCVSCNPLSTTASGDARLQNLSFAPPPVEIHNLSEDGTRVFFESSEALSSRDIDGINDIYEWKPGVGGGPATLELISSGVSAPYPPLLEQNFLPKPNTILGITPSGSDVVFSASEQLVPAAGAGGTQAFYDARVNGGFPEPTPPMVCSGEICRGAAAPAPSFPAPASERAKGRNVKPRKARCHRRGSRTSKKNRRCRKRHSKRKSPTAGLSSASRSNMASAESSGSSGSTESSSSQAAMLAAVSSDFDEFGVESVDAGLSTSAAAAHPDFTTSFVLNHHVVAGREITNARLQSVSISLPPGLVGSPPAIPRCKTGDFAAFANCPVKTQVGISKVRLSGNPIGTEVTEPLYNLEPPHPDREIARFGFFAGIAPVFIDFEVRSSSDYGVTATVHGAPAQAALLAASTTIWGNPPAATHDEQRLTTEESFLCPGGTACKAVDGKRASGLEPTAFLTNPSACQPMKVDFSFTSYQLPGQVFSKSAPMGTIANCQGLPFDPAFEATPTSRTAGAPTGLQASLQLPQGNDPDAVGTATMREARISLPEGMSIAAGAADGIADCSDEQVGLHREVDAACPAASKLGTATIVSPALAEPLRGAIYQRSPSPGHQFGLWLAADDLGLHVKLPGEVEPNPTTGQLTAVFTSLPQVPVEEISLEVWGGPRAPLKNPDDCGSYSTIFAFTPHSSDPPKSGSSEMTIDEGCDAGFSPILHAGVTSPLAGSFSPFVFDLIREDGEQSLRGFELTLPPGELAKLRGVPLCPDAQAAVGACPLGSRIGHVVVASGPGPAPLWLPQPGKAPTAIYLAGPYDGAPFSVVTAVPAQAGPFDLGVVAVRSGLDVDRESAQAIVKADPLPQFVEGVATSYRRIRAVVDRPSFSLNPTNCSELAVRAKVTSNRGAVATPSARFQVNGCKALRFKPKLTLKLKGGTKRSDYPAFVATLKARNGDANLGKVSVGLPHSEFLAQEHIGTICTRKQFAVHHCPKRSIYGKAKAWTPLLDKPLAGPVYLRSSDNPLPDLVMDLRGRIEIAVAGHIDSKNGGIRTTFATVPDAPIVKFVLKMQGGEKGLLINSADICRTEHRATVQMRAQNGRRILTRPVLSVQDCGGR